MSKYCSYPKIQARKNIYIFKVKGKCHHKHSLDKKKLGSLEGYFPDPVSVDSRSPQVPCLPAPGGPEHADKTYLFISCLSLPTTLLLIYFLSSKHVIQECI